MIYLRIYRFFYFELWKKNVHYTCILLVFLNEIPQQSKSWTDNQGLILAPPYNLFAIKSQTLERACYQKMNMLKIGCRPSSMCFEFLGRTYMSKKGLRNENLGNQLVGRMVAFFGYAV